MLSKLFFYVKKSTSIHKFMRIDFRIFLILISIVMYAAYLQRQYIDIYFESQFLHIKFLEDLVQGRITPKGFFTVFGEHLFPGYNLILAVNYYLFKIWGGFDPIIYLLSLIGSVLVFSKVVKSIAPSSNVQGKLAIAFSIFALMSTTNNPQWGMALAASVGVAIMLFCLYRFSLFLNGSQKNIGILTLLSIPIVIVIFLGGYAVGFIASIFAVVLISTLHNKSSLNKSKYVLLIVISSVLIYAAIVMHYGSLAANRPKGDSFEVLTSAKFFIVMMASSLLGRATFESLHSLVPYYICGTLLTYWVILAYFHYAKRTSAASIFFIALLTYSIANIFVVSLFRYKNGIEGGMGQWYNVHTHFIAPIVVVFILETLTKNDKILSKLQKYVSLFLLVLAGLFGYCVDMQKAPYVKIWKQQFVNQTQVVLTSPEEILDKDNLFNTMLWYYPEAKAGVSFLYKNSLWIFKNKASIVDGPTSDGWVVADKQSVIVCPSGTASISFDSWRLESWDQSKVKVLTANGASSVDIINTTTAIRVNPDLAFIKIQATNESNPISSPNDPRQLVFVIKNIACINNPHEKLPASDLQVINWGPQRAAKGEVPNPQPGGGVGVWINISSDSERLVNDGIDIFIGEIKADNLNIQKDLITASFNPSFTNESGEYKLYVQNKTTGAQTLVGTFVISQ